MQAMAQSTEANYQQREEERLLQMALEASNQEGPVNDPDNPDVDNMTYEQLMEMGENAGKVNKGYSQEVINSLKPILWREGKTKEDSCSITFDDFTIG